LAFGSITPQLTSTILGDNGQDCYSPTGALDLSNGYNVVEDTGTCWLVTGGAVN
jgi:hypothetical protein